MFVQLFFFFFSQHLSCSWSFAMSELPLHYLPLHRLSTSEQHWSLCGWNYRWGLGTSLPALSNDPGPGSTQTGQSTIKSLSVATNSIQPISLGLCWTEPILTPQHWPPHTFMLWSLLHSPFSVWTFGEVSQDHRASSRWQEGAVIYLKADLDKEVLTSLLQISWYLHFNLRV